MSSILVREVALLYRILVHKLHGTSMFLNGLLIHRLAVYFYRCFFFHLLVIFPSLL